MKKQKIIIKLIMVVLCVMLLSGCTKQLKDKDKNVIVVGGGKNLVALDMLNNRIQHHLRGDSLLAVPEELA